jgi:hypothetical protein
MGKDDGIAFLFQGEDGLLEVERGGGHGRTMDADPDFLNAEVR